MSWANRDNFISFFLIWMPFISFYCLIALARTSSTVLNRSGESGHFSLVPDLSGKGFSLSLLSVMLAWACIIWPLLCSSMFLLYPVCREFYHEKMLNFVQCPFCIYWDDHMIFILRFINMVYHIDWFMYIEESLHPWDKPHLIVVYDPFNVLLDSVC